MEGSYGKDHECGKRMGSDGRADMVEGPVEEVTYEEMIKAMNKMKLGKAAVPLK